MCTLSESFTRINAQLPQLRDTHTHTLLDYHHTKSCFPIRYIRTHRIYINILTSQQNLKMQCSTINLLSKIRCKILHSHSHTRPHYTHSVTSRQINACTESYFMCCASALDVRHQVRNTNYTISISIS